MYILQLVRMQDSSNHKSYGLLKMKTNKCITTNSLVNGLWFGRVVKFQPHYGLGFM
jgi:hypothetical protein